jgi:hypothetical protein
MVGFSTDPSSRLSALIRWFTNARCSHTFVVVPEGGRNIVYEEADTGYSKIPLDDFLAGNTLIALRRPRVPLDVGWKKSLPELGQKYGELELDGMAIVLLARRFGWHIANPLRQRHAMICSARVTKIMQDSGDELAEKLDPASTDPEDVLLYLESVAPMPGDDPTPGQNKGTMAP